jgi:hypothetical protein
MRGHARLRGVLPGFLGLAACLAALGSALPAEARVEAVRWRYSEPGRVTGFRIHVGTTPGAYTQVIDAGKPQRNANGVYAREISVADGATVYVAVSAYDGQQQSPLSNVTTRSGTAPPPNNPPPNNPPPNNPPPNNPPPNNPPPSNPPPSNPPPSNPPPGNPPPDSAPHHQPDRPDGPDRPAPDESKLRERFSGYEEGASPDGWVDTGPGNRDASDPLFGVLSLKKNKVLATSSTANDIYSHYVTSASVNWSRYEFTGRMLVDDPAAGIGITVLSQHPDRDAYYRVRSNGSDGGGGGAGLHGGSASPADFQVAPRPDRPAGCTLAATGVTPEADVWYRFRVQVAAEPEGTHLRAKVWKRGSSQPKAWQIDCLDTSDQRLLRGVPGVWSSGPGTKMWDDLTVQPLGKAPKRERHGAPPGKPILGE